MDIIFLGDSLTFGYGLSSGNGFIRLISSTMTARIKNLGYNGATSCYLLDILYERVIKSRPHLVHIMMGTNDFLMNYSVDSVMEVLDIMIDDCKSINSSVIIGIPPLIAENLAIEYWDSDVDYTAVNEKLICYRNSIIDYCREKFIPYIDYLTLIREDIPLPLSEKYIDGIHPSDAVQPYMAEAAKRLIKEHLMNGKA